MPLSFFAQNLLKSHAQYPKQGLYDVKLLGSFFRDNDVGRLDAAYEELVQAKLLDRLNMEVRFLGEPKPLYVITPLGLERAADQSAA